jgi:hypothetical protein
LYVVVVKVKLNILHTNIHTHTDTHTNTHTDTKEIIWDVERNDALIR